MFQKANSKQDFLELEEEILTFWQKEDIFELSIKNRDGADEFIFYEGPPTANGRPGLHHVLARIYKDLICRYKTMSGFRVARRAGWDTQGLPVELEVEKALGISGKKEIEKYGVDEFNKKCKESVWKYKEDWEKLTSRIGFWLDMSDPYITYESEYIEKLWSMIKKIYDRGLLYEDFKVLPYCPRCGTSLSEHEVAQGYKKIKETSIYVKFALADESNTSLLVWTTTPWTLPGNVALAIDENMDYALVEVADSKLILAKDRLGVIKEDNKILEVFKGKELIGKVYRPLFDFTRHDNENVYKVYGADFIENNEGTGIVHVATMYGQDDYELGKKYDLPNTHTVDLFGKFVGEVKPWAGRSVKDTEKEIIQDLSSRQLLYKEEQFEHDYPFCWRCDSPLLYYAKTGWFIKTTALKEKMISENNKINWIPAYIKEGRFGNWLENLQDWAFSRDRYWGTPLPIWKCESCKKIKVIGSFKELGVSDDFDPHRPAADEIILDCECGGKMKRVPEICDVWFDSGAMPFASGEFEAGRYPADFIAEAIDQTRGWFYTLLAVGVFMDKGTSYKNVISLGHILDDKGQKMSKSRGNIINPDEAISKFGIDALRWYFFTVNHPGQPKRFSFDDLQDSFRRTQLILWNIYVFFTTYAPADGFDQDFLKQALEPKNYMDKWLTARLNQIISQITKDLDEYQIVNAARTLSQFVSELSTWYLRVSRKRRDKEFYQHLCLALTTVSKLMAPFCPFISDSIYRNLTGEMSVHLADWPKFEPNKVDEDILNLTVTAQEIISEVLSKRAQAKIKIRQPLSRCMVKNISLENDELLEIIKNEINVKELILEKGEGKLQIELDTQITPGLREEGILRELTRLIQGLRKGAKYNVNDKIEVYYQTESDFLKNIIYKYQNELIKECLAQSFSPEYGEVDFSKECEIIVLDDTKQKIWLGVKK